MFFVFVMVIIILIPEYDIIHSYDHTSCDASMFDDEKKNKQSTIRVKKLFEYSM